jgi:hypothetical protein
MATPVILKKKIGVMEYWSDGVMEETRQDRPITPVLQYSTTPVLQNSTTPLLQLFRIPLLQ